MTPRAPKFLESPKFPEISYACLEKEWGKMGAGDIRNNYNNDDYNENNYNNNNYYYCYYYYYYYYNKMSKKKLQATKTVIKASKIILNRMICLQPQFPSMHDCWFKMEYQILI